MPVAVGLDAQRLAGAQLVERPRRGVGAQEVRAPAGSSTPSRASTLPIVSPRRMRSSWRQIAAGPSSSTTAIAGQWEGRARSSSRAVSEASCRVRARRRRRRKPRAARARFPGGATSRERHARRSRRRFALESVACVRVIGPGVAGRSRDSTVAPLRRLRIGREASAPMAFDSNTSWPSSSAAPTSCWSKPSSPRSSARQAAADQGGLRSDAARPAPRPHRPVQQAAAAAGPRPSHHVPDRRLHRDDRRSDRPQRDAPGALARGNRGQRQDLHRPGVPDPRSRQDRGRVQLEVALAARRRRDDQARGEVHGRAHAGARRLRASATRAASRSRSTNSSTRWRRATTRSRSRPTSSSAAPTRSSTCWSAASCSGTTGRSRSAS